MSPPTPFDLAAELAPGITVLEASAGTGKTYTIAALAARFVAGGIGLEQMLLVTFTRMATGELRERVRERLLSSERLLSGVLAGLEVSDAADALDQMLAAGSVREVTARRDRLTAALAGFDSATIETTHSFCNEVLTELGTLGDLDAGIDIVESVDDIRATVVDDLYVRRFWRNEGTPQVDRRQAGIVADAADRNPDAVIYPLTEPSDPAAAMRKRLAQAVRDELTVRKRQLGLMTYDDLVSKLYSTLSGDNGAEAARRLRHRYRVVLIDEFQDTDPTQWQSVKLAFGGGDTQLVLIADPKQAIYAFRGADVYAYLAAARDATSTHTLATNFRSDARLLAGFDALFGGTRLGHEDIAYRQVSASARHHGWRLRGTPEPGALRFRVLDRSQIAQTRAGYAETGAARRAVATDVAVDIVALLSAGTEIETRDGAGAVTGTRPLGCGDIAVLVDKHRNAGAVQEELEAAGVPVVIAGAGSVMITPAAGHWLTLLEALERPSSPLRARTGALTPLVGWDAVALAEASEAELDALHRDLYRWGRLFAEHGVATMTQTLFVDTGVAARLLARRGGERLLTDLQHVGELLQRAFLEEQLGLSALTAWLRKRIDAAAAEGAHGDERTRRLDSDAAAVQVLTIHRSKGLEWPVVYCPYLWDTGRIGDDLNPVYFHDSGGTRGVDVSLTGTGYDNNRKRHIAEERGEDLRLAYVALTRACHRAVVHWAGSWDAANSPLNRLLFARDGSGNVSVFGPKTQPDGDAFAAFEAIAAGCQAPGAVTVDWARPTVGASWSPPLEPPSALAAARFERSLDSRWRRTSYTALTARAHDRRVGSEPESDSTGLTDEPEVEAEEAPAPGSDLPLAAMAAGPAVGTVIHRALDVADFAADSLVGELALALASVGGARGADLLGCPIGHVATGLALALSTPLTGLDGLTLAGTGAGDRLNELDFELPLAGGDRPDLDVTVTLSDIGALLSEFVTGDSPLAGYPDRLSDPLVADVLRGYLTGSIDLAWRVPAATIAPGTAEIPGSGEAPGTGTRYAIVDYKTNWLGVPGEPLRAADYRPDALAAEMQRSHYLLQGLLYSAALHRFLRWRLPGYDADRDLAGIHYLFLRGMAGPVPVGSEPTGVFSWTAPPGLIPALSDLLDGRGR